MKRSVPSWRRSFSRTSRCWISAACRSWTATRPLAAFARGPGAKADDAGRSQRLGVRGSDVPPRASQGIRHASRASRRASTLLLACSAAYRRRRRGSSAPRPAFAAWRCTPDPHRCSPDTIDCDLLLRATPTGAAAENTLHARIVVDHQLTPRSCGSSSRRIGHLLVRPAPACMTGNARIERRAPRLYCSSKATRPSRTAGRPCSRRAPRAVSLLERAASFSRGSATQKAQTDERAPPRARRAERQ